MIDIQPDDIIAELIEHIEVVMRPLPIGTQITILDRLGNQLGLRAEQLDEANEENGDDDDDDDDATEQHSLGL